MKMKKSEDVLNVQKENGFYVLLINSGMPVRIIIYGEKAEVANATEPSWSDV